MLSMKLYINKNKAKIHRWSLNVSQNITMDLNFPKSSFVIQNLRFWGRLRPSARNRNSNVPLWFPKPRYMFTLDGIHVFLPSHFFLSLSVLPSRRLILFPAIMSNISSTSTHCSSPNLFWKPTKKTLMQCHPPNLII